MRRDFQRQLQGFISKPSRGPEGSGAASTGTERTGWSVSTGAQPERSHRVAQQVLRQSLVVLVLSMLAIFYSCVHRSLTPKSPVRRIPTVLHELDNGLRILLQENHTAPVVAIQMWVDVGSADDPPEFSGMAHILEHMVFKGTSHRSEGQIAMAVEGAGGQINAWTSFDQTVFHVVIASRFFDRGLEILSDAIQNSLVEEDGLQREKQVILEEIKQGEDTPSRMVSKNLFAAAYKKHTYGRPVIGEKESVGKVQREHVREYFNNWYVPSNMTLVIVGDFDEKKALTRIKRLFNSSRKKIMRNARIQEPVQRKTRISAEYRDVKEAYISLAFHIPGLKDPSTPALDLGAVILGQGESSRLSRKVKHEQQLVTTAYAYSYTPRDPGLLVVSATSSPEKLLPAIQALAREAMMLGQKKVTADELQRAKTLVESDAVYQKETVQGQARKLGFYQTVAGSVAFERDYNKGIASVSPTQLRQVASRYLHPSNLSIAVVSPLAKDREKELTAELRETIKIAKTKVKETEKVYQTGGNTGIIKVSLGNGATLVVKRDSSVPLVSMRAVWKGGLRFENPSNNGINSLLAALISRGTTSRTADQINGAIEGMAGSIGGFSGHNSFGLRTELLSKHWEQGFEILADCLLNPAFEPKEVERERRALLDDIIAQEDNLGSVALRLFARTMYKRHPYRMDTLGQVASVTSLSRRQLISYYKRYFHPSGMVLAIVGDVDPERVKEKFRQLFGGYKRRQIKPVKVSPEPIRQAAEDAYLFVNKQQAHIVVGYPGTTMRRKDRFPLEVLATALSGQGGRLFYELRDRQGLAYQVGAFSQEGLEPGHFAIYIATSPNKIQRALAGIELQVKRLREELVSAEELKRVQRYLVGSFEISLQRRSMVASLMAFHQCYELGYKRWTLYAPSILAVTPQDLRRVARKYLTNEKKVVVIVKPEKRSPKAEELLGKDRKPGVVRKKPHDSISKKKATNKRKTRGR